MVSGLVEGSPTTAAAAREAERSAAARPRVPPTPEEIEYVHRCVQQIAANMRSPWSEREPEPLSVRPAYASPEVLDRINPLPNGRKRVPALVK